MIIHVYYNECFAGCVETHDLESKLQCIDMEKLVLAESNKALTESLKKKDAQIEEKNAELRKKQEELDYQKTTLKELENNLSDADKLSHSLKAAQTSIDGKVIVKVIIVSVKA